MAFTDGVPDGGEILLYLGTDLIACATSHSIEMNAASRDTSCKGTDMWGSSAPGRLTWSASCDGLYNPYTGDATKAGLKDLFDAWVARNPITLKSEYDDGNGNTETMTGSAAIISISFSAGDGENATYSVSFEGRGALSYTTVEA